MRHARMLCYLGDVHAPGAARQREGMNSRSHSRSIVTAAAARVVALWAAATLFACLAAPASAQATAGAPAATEKTCVDCHDDPKLTAEGGKSMTVSADVFKRSAHRKLDCVDCHESGKTAKHPKEALGAVKPQVCQECHADELKAIAGSVHGRRAKGDKAVKDCTSCHDSLHRVRKEGDPESSLSPVNQIKTCGGCHDDMMADYERSEHARALLKSGLVGSSPSCSSCHGKHDIRAKDDAAATTNRANVSETCGKCHSTVLHEWKDSAHGTALGTKADAPVCSTCHESHAIRRADSTAVRSQVADRCGDCHQTAGVAFLDSYHGKASTLKSRKAAVCADCHTPHRVLAKSDQRSSIHPDNLAQTCGACHANANASFLTFDPHANPKDPKRNFYVYLVWLGMTGMLLSVFGFFGVHDLLWLQRTLVGLLRREFTPAHDRTGPHVRRFTSMQIWVHVSIVLSFLLLAATGLPLKYAEASWAPGLMAVFGGPEVAGVLHRFCALVTFGYFAWHLGMVAYDVIVKKERGFFWGPRSMVPQPRDLIDLWAMIKFFLYIGPRPKFDRFTYWEKFDYLGVFWGVAVIGISGLVLWWPTLATLVLPGWALNAAYVIHSDEALLATGFIFLFHFFHTHLRPEAFPLDTVVFTGRIPLAAFKNERPLEYERLVAQGKLEARLAPAPTALELRVARIFGFTTLAIGVVLAVFIFWALLGSLRH